MPIRNYRSAIILSAIGVLCYVSLYLIFGYQVHCDYKIRLTVAVAMGDGALLMAPLWIFRNRWRFVSAWILGAVSLFLLCNVLYFRYWGGLIPFSLIFKAGSYNTFVLNSVPSLLRWTDIVYLIIPAVFIAAYRYLGMSKVRHKTHGFGLAAFVGLIIIWCGGQTVTVISAYRYWRTTTTPATIPELISAKFNVAFAEGISVWNGNGIILYLANQITKDTEKPIPYTEEIRTRIESHMASRDRIEGTLMRKISFSGNEDKNLILIIVESLNSRYIGLEIAENRLTPVLDSLISLPGTISCLTMVSQIGDGSSSDGQLMYNSGLLPLRTGAVSMSFANNRFYSLASETGLNEPTELIVEKSDCWNHYTTSRSFHYIRMTENLGKGLKGISKDQKLFETALEEIQTKQAPSLTELTTLTMHSPFDDNEFPRASWIDRDNSLSQTKKNYMQMLHEFDRTLGAFLEGLRRTGVLDNSIVVIASDHAMWIEAENEEELHQPIAFLALNTGHSERITRPVGQIDVYPTILEIMNKKGVWPGLGMSILNPENTSSVGIDGKKYGESSPEIDSLKAEAWKISDLIIRSDYFRHR